MKKSTMGVIIAAVIMVLIGGGLFVGGMLAAGGIEGVREKVNEAGFHGVYEFKGNQADVDVDIPKDNSSKENSIINEEPQKTDSSSENSSKDTEEPAGKSEANVNEVQSYSNMEPLVFGKEEVKRLYMKADEAEVEIGTSSGSEISVQTDGNYEIYVRNGSLHIKSKGIQEKHQLLIEIPALQESDAILFEEVEISAGASEVYADQISAKEFELKIDAGMVEIEQLTANHAEFDVGAGEILIDYGNVRECETNVDLGNFEYAGIVSKHGDIECNMGNVVFNLEKEIEEYNFEIECGAGNIDIGSESFSGLGREKYINHQSQESFEIECNMGNVSINSSN